MATSARGERTILIYQGNTLAIVKAMPREMLGIEKMMMFTLGYWHISALPRQCYWPLTGNKTAAYLAERSAHPRSIGLESQLFDH
jgi:hypothetical protein